MRGNRFIFDYYPTLPRSLLAAAAVDLLGNLIPSEEKINRRKMTFSGTERSKRNESLKVRELEKKIFHNIS